MNYVTDLLAVKPEEIQHKNGDEVVAIYPRSCSRGLWLVVMKDAEGNHWSSFLGDVYVYKPRTKRVLKPLHVILSENPYYVSTLGNIYFPDLDSGIGATEMHLFTGTAAIPGWPESFYTEVEG